MKKYTIGVDFGTLSGRSVLIDIDNGDVLASSVREYKNKVITDYLPETDIKLGFDYALQDPNDYLDVLKETIPSLLNETAVSKDQIIGLSIDFTACTVVAVDKNNAPMCFNKAYKDNPHAWIKLWKHHAAQPYADELNALAHKENTSWINRYGGKISSEWLFPKVLQVLREDYPFYQKVDNFLEATDWVTSQLTGHVIRNTCTLGYKAIYHHEEGFPSKDFFKKLDPRMENIIEEKIKGTFKDVGELAGTLTPEWAKLLGLSEHTAIAVGNVDAHVSAPAVNVTKEGQMLMIMGTSTCDILLGKEEKKVPGMCGVVLNGAIPGYYAYESGQSAVGDIFAWFTDHYISKDVEDAALKNNQSVHDYLEAKASKLRVGESGLLALDWFGGNRSILVDTDVSGLILGMTLQTKPEEIYRALIESTAFGKKIIIDNFEDNGVKVDELYVCGGLPNKNKLLLQIYADVLNRPIKIADSEHTPALGAAMFASVAARDKGGHKDIFTAAEKMAKVKDKVMYPNKENVLKYQNIYQEFQILHDYFGIGVNNVMKRLKKMKG
ncbi:MAG: ribulokinase [Candidatus Izemoplasmataceae bacterium]